MNHLLQDAKERIEDGRSAMRENYHSEPVWDCDEASRFLRIHPGTVKRLARVRTCISRFSRDGPQRT